MCLINRELFTDFWNNLQRKYITKVPISYNDNNNNDI